ncbi:MAG: sigma-54-dependent transcriptional regulator [Acidobacteriota bacterium]
MKDAGKAQGLVLVVDDDVEVCDVVGRWLEQDGYEVEGLHSGESCLRALTRTLPDAVCLDLQMPGMSGLETLERVKANHSHLPVIILTGDTSVEAVVAAMKGGAYDYLTKPLDYTKLLTTVRNAVDRYRMTVRLTQLEREVEGKGFPGMIGSSGAMKRVFRDMDRVAASEITVLIWGESGTGKEVVARAIHRTSRRKNGPFMALNCAAIPETLQESELFGHEKGAFTGATARLPGRFEMARGGTLFLDEVADLSLAVQAKLLRVLQDQSFYRVGGTSEIQSDFRLIAATNRILGDEVKAGRFRDDLYFRIAVFEIEIPPLRNRQGDVLLLAEEFLCQYAAQHDKSDLRLSPEACEVLMSYSWPGNVRELQNVMQRSVVVSSGDVILPEDLSTRLGGDNLDRGAYMPEGDGGAQVGTSNDVAAVTAKARAAEPHPGVDTAGGGPDGPVPSLNLETIERRAIKEALKRTKGNIPEIVRLLGISRTTLYRKLKKYKLR